jgi:hypothetical protein
MYKAAFRGKSFWKRIGKLRGLRELSLLFLDPEVAENCKRKGCYSKEVNCQMGHNVEIYYVIWVVHSL